MIEIEIEMLIKLWCVFFNVFLCPMMDNIHRYWKWKIKERCLMVVYSTKPKWWCIVPNTLVWESLQAYNWLNTNWQRITYIQLVEYQYQSLTGNHSIDKGDQTFGWKWKIKARCLMVVYSTKPKWWCILPITLVWESLQAYKVI